MPDTSETLALVQRYQADRDQRAITQLLRENQRWLRDQAYRWARKLRLDLDDAQQAVRIGFAQAVETFDPTVGATLHGYAAASHIRKQVMHAAAERNLSPVLPQGLHAYSRLHELRKAMRSLAAEGIPITDEAIVERTGWGIETVGALRNAERCTSLDLPVGVDGEATLLDFLPSEAKSQQQLAVEKLDGAKVMEAVESILDGVPVREADIFRRRFIEEETLEQIGEDYGITKERVRQLERRVVTLMREGLGDDPRVDGFLD